MKSARFLVVQKINRPLTKYGKSFLAWAVAKKYALLGLSDAPPSIGKGESVNPVSYTHLTLPTICSV